MSVIKRLRRLAGEANRQTREPERSAEIAALRKRIDAILARRPEYRPAKTGPPGHASFPLADVIPGQDYANHAGVCFIRESHVDTATRHGHRRIGDFAGVSMEAASFLADNASLADYRLEEGLFLDTETTGLAGGTGTMAFLIGLGWFDRGAFIVRQIFARDFAEERAALIHLAEIVAGRRFLVSFNGRTFDVGLLSTRYIMNRLHSPPLTDMPHLDLLYPARRLVAHRLENCRLSTIETQVLGLIRSNDVPGADIPQRYFDWLRTGDARLLRDVFTHNRLDIISLAALMGHLAALTQDCRETAADARDLLAVARLYAARRRTGQAQRLLSSLAASSEPGLRAASRKSLSLLYKRTGRMEDAVDIWRDMIRDDPEDRFALIELAKWHEHRAQDYTAALMLVGNALRQAGGAMTAAEREALLHRRKRLQRRQAERTPDQ